MSLKQRMLAYCACSLGFSLLNHVFFFYYVKVFLNYYKIEEGWFQFAQMLYLVWNMINDPLFAYIQDTTNFRLTKTRREAILYTAPLFSLSFILIWFPWAQGTWVTGLHLITALCLYDTFFTYIGLAFCCLFTEISSDPKVRLQLTQWSNIAGLLASFSVFICEFTSDSLKSFQAFQLTTVVIAVVAAIMMVYTGLYAHTEHDINIMQSDSSKEEVTHKKSSESSVWRLTWQILSERNFIAFVIVNFFQGFHRTFFSNFVAIIFDELIPDDVVSSSIRKMFYGSLNIVASVIVIFGVPLVQNIGYSKTIKWSFIWKIFAGIIMFMLGRQYIIIMMIYVLLDSAFSWAAFTFFVIPLSEIADHDMYKYKRSHPITSMVFGTNALIVKPAQSLCPMLTVAILNRYGYEEHKTGKLGLQGLDSLKDTMFLILCGYSCILGIIQYISWSKYVLKPQKSRELVISVPSQF
ncbi:hypothetical protein SNE40_019143 [Patella caerulea]|uniref:Uncharacterized protein n=2 Tax=Patella caerulea TaxID=87958 RepID=A0AAN8J6I7_PATCE